MRRRTMVVTVVATVPAGAAGAQQYELNPCRVSDHDPVIVGLRFGGR